MVGRKTLLRKLGERRLVEGLTQIQTAKAIGISATCLSQFVTGKRNTQQAVSTQGFGEASAFAAGDVGPAHEAAGDPGFEPPF